MRTKAETLEFLQPKIQSASIAPLIIVQYSDWTANQKNILSQIKKFAQSKFLAVRSSAKSEDGSHHSQAGAYLTLLHINSKNDQQLLESVNKVFQSYGSPNADDQVLIQHQITSVRTSGVIFSRDLDTKAPYLTFNIDDSSGSTSSVTSGSSNNLKTYIRFRKSKFLPQTPLLGRLVKIVDEVENLLGLDGVDIEFVESTDGELFLTQARPLTGGRPKPACSDQLFSEHLLRIKKKFNKLNSSYPGIKGSKTLFSVMTDWNPAEMIGTRPRPLALSLYKELITDSVWAYQRTKYGYRDCRSFPLLFSFLGVPYIDVRSSFNSFVPEALNDAIADKLINYYLDNLRKNPKNHDKVEFETVFTCYDFTTTNKLKKLGHEGFSDLEIDRIKFALLNLTNKIIDTRSGFYKSDLEKINILESRYNDLLLSDVSIIDKMYWLIEDCKRYGTLPFAGLARAGFVSVQFLKSFVETGIFSNTQYQEFMLSLDTVTNKFAKDLKKFNEGEYSREALIENYGHLRPGTYDILSPRYDEQPDRFFRISENSQSPNIHEFTLNADQHRTITAMMQENGLEGTPETLLDFIKAGIEGREYAKFIFTKSVSRFLHLLEIFGKQYGVTREELSWISVHRITHLYSSLSGQDVVKEFRTEIESNKDAYTLTESIKLPELISNEEDIEQFEIQSAEPNFVTHSRVTSIVVLEENLQHIDLTGKIIIVKSADPGYDWLFSHNIGGLITMFGGANSHMAIRCAELKIPAVIGCGEKYFSQWVKAEKLDIDCANRKVYSL